jgi:hypothetical protein
MLRRDDDCAKDVGGGADWVVMRRLGCDGGGHAEVDMRCCNL